MNMSEALSLVNSMGNITQLRPARLLSPQMVHEIETKSLGTSIQACLLRKPGTPTNTLTARPVVLGGGTSFTEVDIKQKTTSATNNIDDQIDTTDIVANAWTQFTSAAHQIPKNRFISLHGVWIGPMGSKKDDRITSLKFLKGSETVAYWNTLDCYDPVAAGGVATKSDQYCGYGEGYSVYQYPVWCEQDYFTGYTNLSTGGTTANAPCKLKGWTVETGAQTVAPLKKA